MDNTKFTNINVVTLKQCNRKSLQVKVRSHLYYVWNMYTNICLYLYDPKWVQMERVTGSVWTRSPWDHINRGRCLYTYSRQNINGCEFVTEEAHCHIALRSQHCFKKKKLA